jgi:hypothetical protein
MNISSRPFSLETRSKERLDLCVVRMTTGYSETADAMKLATPLNAEEATGDRRQDATLDKPWRNVSGVQQVIKLEEKPRLSRTTNFHIVRVAGSRSSLAEIVPTETVLRFQSIFLLYMGRLCCHTSHAAALSLLRYQSRSASEMRNTRSDDTSLVIPNWMAPSR